MHSNRDKNSGHLGHTISHTDTAQGKGGGQMTESGAPTAAEESDSDDTSPTNRQGGGDENAKNADYRTPSEGLNEQDPEEVAGRMGTTGQGTGIA